MANKGYTIKEIASLLGLDGNASQETIVRGYVSVLVEKGVLVKVGIAANPSGRGKGSVLFALSEDWNKAYNNLSVSVLANMTSEG